MEKRITTSSPSPKVILKVDGNLTLKGWDEMEILAKSSSQNDLAFEQSNEQVTILGEGDCSVRVPLNSQVTVERVEGNAIIKSLDSDLVITRVDGNLTLRGIGQVDLDKLDGNLVAKNISGSLTMIRIDGNATLKDIQGDLTVKDAIHGNLVLKDIDGNVQASASGNVTSSFDPAPGNKYAINAGGNILCRIPEDASLKLEIPKASSIMVKLPGAVAANHGRAPYSQVLGEGDSEVLLSAGGNVLLAGMPPDWEDTNLEVEIGKDFEDIAETFGSQVTQQFETQMQMLEQQIEAQLAGLTTMVGTSGFTPEQAEKISLRAKEAGERASLRAQERIQRSQERLERKLEAARRRAEMRTRTAELAARDRRRREETYEWAPTTPILDEEQVSEEERLAILQMLEQGKITPEEAEQLLMALEGRG